MEITKEMSISLGIAFVQMFASVSVTFLVGRRVSRKVDFYVLLWLFYDVITHFTLVSSVQSHIEFKPPTRLLFSLFRRAHLFTSLWCLQSMKPTIPWLMCGKSTAKLMFVGLSVIPTFWQWRFSQLSLLVLYVCS